MKIQCDVCRKGEASVFCCADEAALCDACDRRVHRANKLASKHRRFSISFSDQTQPLCDICKEKRGLIFCQQDRAILCRDCDDPIHSANQLTMKHSRFLLTGARLSAAPLSCDMELESNNNNKPANDSIISSSHSSSSSISDYLIKTLPGYRVEDLLDDDATGLYKTDEIVPFSEPADLAIDEEIPIWVPRVPQIQLSTGINGLIQCNYGFDAKQSDQQQQQFHGLKRPTEQQSGDLFMVPQINNNYTNKRTKPASAWDF